MEKSGEVATTDEPVRRTRSGRTVRPPATPSTLTLKAPAIRKKKKVVMVEVEVSDEDDVRDETDNSHNGDTKEDVDTTDERSTVELENSDNAVEASEQFIQTNDSTDFDNCSNTAQFPEDSSNIIDNEINSFKGAINTSENGIDNFMEVAESEFIVELPQDVALHEDAEDSQQFKQSDSFGSKTSLLDEGMTDEFLTGGDSLAGGDSLVEGDSLTGDLLAGDSLVEPSIFSAGDSLSSTEVPIKEGSLSNENEKMDTDEVQEAQVMDTNVQENVSESKENTQQSETEDVPQAENKDVLSPTNSQEEINNSKKTSKIRIIQEALISEAEKTIIEVDKTDDPDTEVISEDELPGVQVAKVPETEEVSDEELPGPKRAELPADTEVVSEDELPTVKKEGTKRKLTEGDYDPGSPTSENENPTKKPALEPESDKEKDEKPKPKKLPELDKYWKAVNDDPTDFTGWTYLLQYVDQENDMEAAREAYDAFLSHYPYCYGYWRKYADYEKRKGNKKKCEEVFERGLKAIPLSVDLWIHYLTYVRTSRAEDEEYIRSQFERAIIACGLEFRSDRLWDSYIKWETEAKRLQHVTAIYDKLLTTPTQGYTTHFDNFQEHIATHAPNKVLEVDEFLALRKEVRHMLKHDVAKDEAESENLDVPPGEDDNKDTVSSDEEVKGIRERIVSIRRKIHKNTVNAVTARWNYEEGIKRPYFHVKPLERCQLKNWQDYLDFEIEQGDKIRTIVLFERCLIACALYEEFWIRYALYLEALNDPEMLQKIKDTYERACTIHHLKKPNLHTQWAIFEESIENYDRAAEILVNLEKSLPNVLQIAFRRINLERRRGDHEKCCQLYEQYISNAKNKVAASNLSIKYARFCHKIMKNIDKAIEILKAAVTKDINNARLYLQLVDFVLQKEDASDVEVLAQMDTFLQKDGIENEQKLLFAQRKMEYVEDFSTKVDGIQKAQEEYQKLVKLVKENMPKKKDIVKTKKEKNPPLPSSQSSSYGNYGNYSNSTNSNNYGQYPPNQGQYNYSQYGQGDQYNYQNWQYPQGSYGGYNQWSGYSGGYNY